MTRGKASAEPPIASDPSKQQVRAGRELFRAVEDLAWEFDQLRPEICDEVRAAFGRVQGLVQDAPSRNIEKLTGLVPMCESCKSVRNDKGYWQELEAYVSQHAEVEFTHGLCPPCLKANG